MPEAPKPEPALRHDLVFNGGKLLQCDARLPYPADPEEDFDLSKMFGQKGFWLSQSVGDDWGVHFSLYEHSDDENWAVVFSTAGRWQIIWADGWINLIELLRHLSPIALAGSLTEQDGYAGVGFLAMPPRVVPPPAPRRK